MASITPFKIAVPDAAITKLKAKLELSDLPDEVDFSNDWNYGAPRDDSSASPIQDDHTRRRLRKAPRSLRAQAEPEARQYPAPLLPRMYVRPVSSASTTLASPSSGQLTPSPSWPGCTRSCTTGRTGYPWTDDEVLTWGLVCVYQFSAAGAAASVRIYYEARHAGAARTRRGLGYVPGVPLGLSYFPRDLVLPPRTWPVVFERVHGEGGHFAACERPEALVADLRAMFGGGARHVAERFV
ncbi:uncharacterized protein G6M90_00g092150 [Metarhizium brunneum]|uniref:Epoxide hydrolase N-terminal domain-containing protein n=1 Tax=Metarhizium brunneum TaxID=500148 RepID=A0A7D5V223_9HYPO|nr:hypothetical protein G6M90_00g092150 [Metarhizium brunneum]